MVVYQIHHQNKLYEATLKNWLKVSELIITTGHGIKLKLRF